MIVHPTIKALLGNDAPQRQVQSDLACLVKSWRGGPQVSAIEHELSQYAAGIGLDNLPSLGSLFQPESVAADALVAMLLDPIIALLRDRPLGLIPLRHAADDHSATLILLQSGSAVLGLHVIDGAGLRRQLPAVCASFSAGETHERVLAGDGEAVLLTIVGKNRHGSGVQLQREAVALYPPTVHCRDGGRECLIVQRVDCALVSLKLQRRPAAGTLARQYLLEDGSLVAQAAGSARDSRLELAAALLGRMGRNDAAPLLASMAEEPGSEALRWQALRECLALDTAVGFSALCAVATRPHDPLGSPAQALRARLLKSYPELEEIADATAH